MIYYTTLTFPKVISDRGGGRVLNRLPDSIVAEAHLKKKISVGLNIFIAS